MVLSGVINEKPTVAGIASTHFRNIGVAKPQKLLLVLMKKSFPIGQGWLSLGEWKVNCWPGDTVDD